MADIEVMFNPPGVLRGRLHDGLARISTFDDAKRQRLLAWARVQRPAGQIGDVGSLVEEAGVPNEHAIAVHLAVSMVVAAMRDLPLSPEQFVQAGLESGAFTNDARAGMAHFAQLVVNVRPELQRQSANARLQNAVLPTLMQFDLALDVRVEVADGKVTRGVPVIAAFVDTDAESQLTWFQMDEARLRELSARFSSLVEQIETLEGWLRTSIPTVSDG